MYRGVFEKPPQLPLMRGPGVKIHRNLYLRVRGGDVVVIRIMILWLLQHRCEHGGELRFCHRREARDLSPNDDGGVREMSCMRQGVVPLGKMQNVLELREHGPF